MRRNILAAILICCMLCTVPFHCLAQNDATRHSIQTEEIHDADSQLESTLFASGNNAIIVGHEYPLVRFCEHNIHVQEFIISDASYLERLLILCDEEYATQELNRIADITHILHEELLQYYAEIIQQDIAGHESEVVNDSYGIGFIDILLLDLDGDGRKDYLASTRITRNPFDHEYYYPLLIIKYAHEDTFTAIRTDATWAVRFMGFTTGDAATLLLVGRTMYESAEYSVLQATESGVAELGRGVLDPGP